MIRNFISYFKFKSKEARLLSTHAHKNTSIILLQKEKPSLHRDCINTRGTWQNTGLQRSVPQAGREWEGGLRAQPLEENEASVKGPETKLSEHDPSDCRSSGTSFSFCKFPSLSLAILSWKIRKTIHAALIAHHPVLRRV